MDLIAILLFTLTIIFYKKNQIGFETLIFTLVFGGVALICFPLKYIESFIIKGGGLPPLILTQEMLKITQTHFTLAMFATLIGSLLVSLFMKRRISPYNSKSSRNSRVAIPYYVIKIFLIVSYLLLLLYFSQNFTQLLTRNSYLFNSGGSLAGNIHYFLPMIGAVAFYFYQCNHQVISSFLLLSISLITLLISFSSASRSIGVILAICTVLIASTTKNLVSKISVFVTGLLATFWATGIVLQLRILNSHGFIPYFSYLTSNYSIAEINTSDILGNFLSTIPITYLGLQISPPPNLIKTSLSPFVGKSTDWYEIAGSLMVNPWTPSGAVAQAGSLGTLLEISVWMSIGLILGVISNLFKNVVSIYQLQFVSYALVLGALVQMLQYSIRNGMRYLYMDMLFLFGCILFFYRKKTVT